MGRHCCEVENLPQVQILGPVPAPMERRSGRYRSQLLIQSQSRKILQYFLEKWLAQIDAMPGNRKVRWSIDIDPQDLS